METKVCTKCGIEKPFDLFPKTSKGKCKSWCHECQRLYMKEYYKNNREEMKKASKEYNIKHNKEILVKKAEYRKNNKEKIAAGRKRHYEENKEKLAVVAKKYRDDNKEKLKERSREYYIKNKEKIAKKVKEYRIKNAAAVKQRHAKYYRNNKDRIKANAKKYAEISKDKLVAQRKKARNSPSSSRYYLKTLLPIDKPKMVGGFITIVCKNCGKRFTPNLGAIQDRVKSNRTGVGDLNFYCSDECKYSCVLYWFTTNKQTDPRSELYVKDDEAKKVRACQTDHLKKLQLDEYGYNFCEKCGMEVDVVHLHHTLPVAKYGEEAVSSAGHMLLCQECHVELHEEC